MATYSRRERVEHVIEYTVPTPANHAEIDFDKTAEAHGVECTQELIPIGEA